MATESSLTTPTAQPKCKSAEPFEALPFFVPTMMCRGFGGGTPPSGWGSNYSYSANSHSPLSILPVLDSVRIESYCKQGDNFQTFQQYLQSYTCIPISMADIFISYAKADKDNARMLAEALEDRGWSVWWDSKIPTGREFDDVIE